MILEVAALTLCFSCGLALATLRAPHWIWALALLAVTAAWQTGVFEGRAESPSLGLLSLLGWLPALVIGALSIPSLRRRFLVAPAFDMIRRGLPRVTETAQQALSAGTIGFDAEFFGGKPNWETLRAIPPIKLTGEEKAFLEGPTEELCGMIDEWQLRHNQMEIPEEIWSFVKKHRFLGMFISKKYGGLDFSAQAQSLVLGKVASRSPDVFTILMIPNSLGPGKLIEKYGTDDQKRYYLPRLVSGQDIPCLSLTGPTSGSDAGAMRDIGIAARGKHQSADTIGIRLSWDKRYITLAPNATLIGLAFHLFDPENLLGKGEDVGVTVALVPADHAGVIIGRRHLPSGTAFPNGPNWGRDVFIPLAWVIGGEKMLGQGWRMLMECLSASRAISLPSCAAAGAKLMLRVSTAYGRIRRQFGLPIARMEALEEPLARMIETAYVNEAGRAITAAMVSQGEKPSVISALMKYQTTERLRRSVNDAMDLHGGRGVCDGPTNYLQSVYQMVPVAITVEGANIVTRTLITFTQAALLSHPYIRQEVQACQDGNERRGLAAFEKVCLDHISFLLSNAAGAFVHNVTGGLFAKVPKGALGTAQWFRQLSRASRNFALVADLAIVLLGGRLKTRQKLTGRLADALSELYLLACVLKRYEDDGRPADDRHIVAFATQNGLHRFQEAMRGVIDNFPIVWARLLMKAIVFPAGSPYRPAPDWLGHKIVGLVLKPGEVRDRLTRSIYVSKDPNDPIGLLEVTFEKVIRAEEAETKLDRAVRQRLVRRYHGIDWIGDALKQSVITESEAGLLREVEGLTARVIAVDHFDPDEVRPNYMTAGHNIRAMQSPAAQ
jgi:acyl-CoA dehydrogenase